ncbi:MAG: hypothetical protein ACLFVU_12135 [Phycisphaerae bacterium]
MTNPTADILIAGLLLVPPIGAALGNLFRRRSGLVFAVTLTCSGIHLIAAVVAAALAAGGMELSFVHPWVRVGLGLDVAFSLTAGSAVALLAISLATLGSCLTSIAARHGSAGSLLLRLVLLGLLSGAVLAHDALLWWAFLFTSSWCVFLLAAREDVSPGRTSSKRLLFLTLLADGLILTWILVLADLHRRQFGTLSFALGDLQTLRPRSASQIGLLLTLLVPLLARTGLFPFHRPLRDSFRDTTPGTGLAVLIGTMAVGYHAILQLALPMFQQQLERWGLLLAGFCLIGILHAVLRAATAVRVRHLVSAGLGVAVWASFLAVSGRGAEALGGASAIFLASTIWVSAATVSLSAVGSRIHAIRIHWLSRLTGRNSISNGLFATAILLLLGTPVLFGLEWLAVSSDSKTVGNITFGMAAFAVLTIAGGLLWVTFTIIPPVRQNRPSGKAWWAGPLVLLIALPAAVALTLGMAAVLQPIGEQWSHRWAVNHLLQTQTPAAPVLSVFPSVFEPTALLAWAGVFVYLFGSATSLVSRVPKRSAFFLWVTNLGFLAFVAPALWQTGVDPGGFAPVSAVTGTLICSAAAAVGLLLSIAYLGQAGFSSARMDGLMGAFRAQPGITLAALLFTASLVGLPVTAGFFVRICALSAGISAGQYTPAATLAILSVGPAAALVDWLETAVIRPAYSLPERHMPVAGLTGQLMRLTITLLVVVVIVLGLLPQLLSDPLGNLQSLIPQ